MYFCCTCNRPSRTFSLASFKATQTKSYYALLLVSMPQNRVALSFLLPLISP